ncbi:N-acetyl-gamma-glutamyl-phosphate reductase [Nocardioides pantholopis]|uniref:N-acetyl-gamma-glutamyl-phosphate reductase n=1 Tax=Nocardioides pantholopis TaxID=2483798 RepID=UPI000FDC411D|nr:N-acetyl-gamma-glutamyl-phosphate reductase [Nocardioides pantholopis]
MHSVGILGGSGFVGGELLRLLHLHPAATVRAVASGSRAGKAVSSAHPHLRSIVDERFIDPAELPEVDVLFSALPHGNSQEMVETYASRCGVLIDLAGDFRLADGALMERHYGWRRHTEHRGAFTYGLPELNRSALRTADRIAVAGCMATAAILALRPLAIAGLADDTIPINVDARTGSSGSGAGSTPADGHALRAGAMRVFAPLRHRHQAEIQQSTGLDPRMTVTSTAAVRGVQVVARADIGIDVADLWRIYRGTYEDEPFIRLVAQRSGAFRYPDPKVLLGSNYCDVGFETDGTTVAVVAALDNLVKGAAGNAVQCMNVRLGLPETTGLHGAGLHPV